MSTAVTLDTSWHKQSLTLRGVMKWGENRVFCEGLSGQHWGHFQGDAADHSRSSAVELGCVPYRVLSYCSTQQAIKLGAYWV